jgi:hypothetical protein
LELSCRLCSTPPDFTFPPTLESSLKPLAFTLAFAAGEVLLRRLEERSTRSRPLSPVPVLYLGPPAPEVEALATVADLGRAVLRWLDAS